MPEYITAHAEDDWECLCGNTPESDGFYPCDEDGGEVEPIAGVWHNLVRCYRCNRIMDQSTFSGASWEQYNATGAATEGTVLVVRGATA